MVDQIFQKKTDERTIYFTCTECRSIINKLEEPYEKPVPKAIIKNNGKIYWLENYLKEDIKHVCNLKLSTKVKI